jgi:hypothetical protein
MAADSLPYKKLPTTVEEFREWRQNATNRTLNDIVEELHLTLYRDEKYRAFLDAVWDEQAVEGSLAADNIMAAQMLRELAKKQGRIEAAGQKLSTLAKSLGVVLRRYDATRKLRRDMVGGQVYPDDTATSK